MAKWAKTFAAWFGISFLGVIVAQFAQVQDALNAGDWDAAKKLQDALNAGDWDAAKKFGIGALVAAVTAGIGSVLTHLTTLVGDPAANRDVK